MYTLGIEKAVADGFTHHPNFYFKYIISPHSLLPKIQDTLELKQESVPEQLQNHQQKMAKRQVQLINKNGERGTRKTYSKLVFYHNL